MQRTIAKGNNWSDGYYGQEAHVNVILSNNVACISSVSDTSLQKDAEIKITCSILKSNLDCLTIMPHAGVKLGDLCDFHWTGYVFQY